MSVWVGPKNRKGEQAWYYQFQIDKKQYSGRAHGATSKAEAEAIEVKHRSAIEAGLPFKSSERRVALAAQVSEQEGATITILIPRELLGALLQNKLPEVRVRLKLEDEG